MDTREIPININTYKIVAPNLDILYPQVYDMKNIKSVQKINSKILKLTSDLVTEQGYFENPMTEMLGTYELKTNEREILSLMIINYAYIPRHAHGITINKSLTFDLKCGKSYKLHELFKVDSNYQKILSKLIEQQIEDRSIPLINEFKGIKSEQDFYISDKLLVLYFQLYEITPYAYGFQHFPISVYEIEEIIDEDGPLGKMIY